MVLLYVGLRAAGDLYKCKFFQLCRLYRGFEFGAKFFSIVILTLMSLERYLLVCTRWRRLAALSWRTVLPLVAGIIVCVILPIIPYVYYTSVYVVPLLNIDVCYTELPTKLVSSESEATAKSDGGRLLARACVRTHFLFVCSFLIEKSYFCSSTFTIVIRLYAALCCR